MFIRYFKLQSYFLITLFIATKIRYCEFNKNVNQRLYANATANNFFRFRDFEPRYALKTDSHRLATNKRNSRGFQFHTDDRDFNVELEFIVPFIHIPIARSMSVTQTAFRSLLNLNFSSILTTSAIVAVGGIFAIILKIVFTQFAYINNFRKSFRKYDATEQDSNMFYQFYSSNNSDHISSIDKFAVFMESKLQENNINISHCIQSSLCSYAQQNFYNRHNTLSGGGLLRIIDGVFNLDFVLDYLSGTAVKMALDSAKNGSDCFKVFNNCNWPFPLSGMLKLFAENFNYINNT